MSQYRLLIPALLLLLFSCSDEPKKTAEAATPAVQELPKATPAKNQSSDSRISEITFPDGQTGQPAAPKPAKVEPAQNAEGVWHYVCPKGCKGGAGSASPCSVCGTVLKHNQAYHTKGGATTQITQPNVQVNQSGNSPIITPPSQANPPAAQNAKGVWHYTCPKGCAGGSGGKGNCAKCGGALAHNKAYHDK